MRWLAIKSDFANCDWVKVYPSPTVVQKQMRELLIAAGHKDPLYPKPLDAASPIYR